MKQLCASIICVLVITTCMSADQVHTRAEKAIKNNDIHIINFMDGDCVASRVISYFNIDPTIIAAALTKHVVAK